jgi:hypothetical protein
MRQVEKLCDSQLRSRIPSPTAPPPPSQRHVLDDMIAQRRVPTDPIVSRAGEEHELAIRRAEHAPESREERVEP